MRLNPLDHARMHIKKAMAVANGFVDANKVASEIHRLYPACDLQLLIDIVVSETIIVRGSVVWEKSGMHDHVLTGRRDILQPAFFAHVLAFWAQGVPSQTPTIGGRRDAQAAPPQDCVSSLRP
jgi:hypothetical protein